MTPEEKEVLQLKVLGRAVRSNHNLGSGDFSITLRGINPDDELKKYLFPIERITKHNLPHRFGMYKPSKSVKKIDDEIEIEEVPEKQHEADPNHKFRSIF